jgi:hypothetical protein
MARNDSLITELALAAEKLINDRLRAVLPAGRLATHPGHGGGKARAQHHASAAPRSRSTGRAGRSRTS